ncbi:GIP [Symbiodinium necroappetens]|uniref:GIP protein n=1 Tax=Symbiodinium necroappetens TaxID=1628268 RepID=A0A812TXY6_9DINO|nr:GIP [Symbiodinium necroappetens]
MVQLGMTLEALMKLARKMWAADDRVNNAMTLILNKARVFDVGRVVQPWTPRLPTVATRSSSV